MRKTKIVCTLGPATDREGVLREMMLAGMNVARFNFSHGTHPEHKVRLDAVKALREELDLPVAAMLDTKGPEVRLRNFKNGSVELTAGQEFTLTTDEDVEGDETRCAISYAALPQDVTVGDTILLDDGLVRLTVLETTSKTIRCRVENDGTMKNHKGVNVPGVSLSMPYMSQQDRDDILFGVEQGFDFIAASFVRCAADIREIRRVLDSVHSHIRIIAKIENQEGVSNLREILAEADGVMVARGDMGVEIDFTEIPVIQKDIIAYTLGYGKHVITATQMLDSMITNPRPTRAEITDVANAVYDGTSAIITVTKSGATPRLISRFRPETPIVACVMDEPVQRQLSLTWGVKPIIMDYVQSTDEMIEGAVSAAQKAGLIHDGEIAVVTAGVPAGIAGTTNMIKVHLVGSSLINGAGVGDENVKGVLCVCRTLEDVRHKFHPGMILVVPHTNNEMLPYIRQATGVITEENGLGSHAAVVGLSLNKAVIVGAIGATRTLHDGMKVSMDCRQGSVQSLAE